MKIKTENISPALIIMGEEVLPQFNYNIFHLDAAKRGFVQPVVITPENFDYQTLGDCLGDNENARQIQKASSEWASGAAIAGIAQYSITRKKPAGILGRFDIRFRYSLQVEMKNDFDHFGEQVISEITDEPSKGAPIINVFGKDYVYTGPLRIDDFIFTTRVFQGLVPSNISQLTKEVDENSVKGELVFKQQYHFFHATRGEISYLPFREPEDFSPEKLIPHGRVEIKDKEMTYFPTGDKSSAVDFTEMLREDI